MSARSCDQLCPITADHQCALMICVAPAAPLCSSMPPASATFQCHINATYQCPSELPVSVTHQCQSVPPISAYQCRLSVPVSAAYQCRLSVPPNSAKQCRLSGPYMS
ncbi:unnamed protein product, partial [Staurois parvus]